MPVYMCYIPLMVMYKSLTVFTFERLNGYPLLFECSHGDVRSGNKIQCSYCRNRLTYLILFGEYLKCFFFCFFFVIHNLIRFFSLTLNQHNVCSLFHKLTPSKERIQPTSQTLSSLLRIAT